MLGAVRLRHRLSLTDLSDLGRHAAAPVRQEGADQPQEWHEDAEDAENVVALAEGHEANGEDETRYKTARTVPKNHCMPDMSCLPFGPVSPPETWARPPEDTPGGRVRLIPRG